MEKITPMQRQYQELKASCPDAILFFRLGDFYEMFGADAVEAARILNIALTSRDRKSPDPLPMCGVPYHAAENYLAKLTKAGKKAAIAEQVSDPSLPGIVQRAITRIVTPGTTFSEQILEAKENQFVAAICEENGKYALAYADLSTADFRVLEAEGWEQLKRELQRLGPKEVILPPDLFSADDVARLCPVLWRHPLRKDPYAELTAHFETKTLKGFGLEEKALAIQAAALLLDFLSETQQGRIGHLRSIRCEETRDFLPLDPETIRNLELFFDSEGRKEGSLAATLDETKTAAGGRMLKNTLLKPLQDQNAIEARLDAVEELTKQPEVLAEVETQLKQIADLERLIARIACGRCSPRDFVALKYSLQKLPELQKALGKTRSAKLEEIQILLNEGK